MTKKSSPQQRRAQHNSDKPDLMPLSAFGGLAGGFFVAYIIAETALSNSVHPLHWGESAAGAGAGYLVGLLYTRLKTMR